MCGGFNVWSALMHVAVERSNARGCGVLCCTWLWSALMHVAVERSDARDCGAL